MINSNQHIEDKLDSCALIIRKYDLGDRVYFFSKFPGMNRETLETAWNFGLQKIQNREIIKDASDLRSDDLEIVTNKLSAFDNNPPERLYYYLNTEFDVKQLKLKDENIERRLRHSLADTFIKLQSAELSENLIKEKRPISWRVKNLLKKSLYIFIILVIIGLIKLPRIINGFTPVSVLTEKIHEKSKYKFNGAICNDGWTSHSQGSGTCSHHDGVDYYFYKGEYSKTIEECRKEAEEISWRK